MLAHLKRTFHFSIVQSKWSLISMWGGGSGRSRSSNPIQGQYWQRESPPGCHQDWPIQAFTGRGSSVYSFLSQEVWRLYTVSLPLPKVTPQPLVNHPTYLDRVWKKFPSLVLTRASSKGFCRFFQNTSTYRDHKKIKSNCILLYKSQGPDLQ